MTKHARTYGQALFDLAKEEGLEDAILADLKAFCAVVSDVPEYTKLLSSPALSAEERNSAIDEAWNGKLHRYTLNFVKLMCDQGSASELSDCCAEFTRLYNEANGIAVATAVCAAPLAPELAEKLRCALEKKTGKKVELTVKVDESLIGGMRLLIDGVQTDNSIAFHLSEIRKLLRNG